MSITYATTDEWPLEKSVCDQLRRLESLIFKGSGPDELFAKIKNKHRVLSVLANSDDKLVGFKIGYEKDTGTFYSWLGGVHPDFRRQGIASELMRHQHERLAKEGYRAVTTTTKNKWREMLILNLRFGFDIIGMDIENGATKIKLQKTLCAN